MMNKLIAETVASLRRLAADDWQPSLNKMAADIIEAQAETIEEYRAALREHAISNRFEDDVGSDTGENAGWYCSCLQCQTKGKRVEWPYGESENHFPNTDGKPCLAAPKPAENEGKS